QYQMPRWQRWLSDNGITQSMSRCGNCLDNAAMESFFSTLKLECYYLNKYNKLHNLKQDIIDYQAVRLLPKPDRTDTTS
ncbi:TPA: transposase family protein, partial [Escherichia coli]|nr:transposase family protein [Escherichia coli]